MHFAPGFQLERGSSLKIIHTEYCFSENINPYIIIAVLDKDRFSRFAVITY